MYFLCKPKLNEKRGGSKVRSWIWEYFEPSFREGVRYAVCKVEEVVGEKCGKTYKIGTSTTLQLVIGKGLAPIVGRAKRLIDFFMSPNNLNS